MERFHQLDDRDVRAGVDELMIGLGGIGPAPSVGEGVELRLAYLPARLAKEDIVIGVGIKRRIEIDEIDTRIGKFFPIRKPFQVVTEIKPIHFRRTARDFSTSVEMTRLHRNDKRMQQLALSAKWNGSAYSGG